MENKDTDYQKVARVGDEKNNHFFFVSYQEFTWSRIIIVFIIIIIIIIILLLLLLFWSLLLIWSTFHIKLSSSLVYCIVLICNLELVFLWWEKFQIWILALPRVVSTWCTVALWWCLYKNSNLLVTFREMPRTELMTDATEIDFFKISKSYVSVLAYLNSSVCTYLVHHFICHNRQLHDQSLQLKQNFHVQNVLS